MILDVVCLHLEEGTAIGWPVVEGMLARDMSLQVAVSQLEAVSVAAQPHDKQVLQEAAVAATEAMIVNFRDEQYWATYHKGQLHRALLSGLKVLGK